ncbi:hypothetical protein GCM10027614_15650 [Micromonospora vulcania]
MRGKLHGAEAGCLVDRRTDSNTLVFGMQEPGVKVQIVRYQDSAAQQPGEVPGNLVKARCGSRLLGRDAVDVLWPEVTVRVNQTAPFVGSPTVLVKVHDGHFDNPIVPTSTKAGGFEVDNCVHGRASYTYAGKLLRAALRNCDNHSGGSGCGSPIDRK